MLNSSTTANSLLTSSEEVDLEDSHCDSKFQYRESTPSYPKNKRKYRIAKNPVKAEKAKTNIEFILYKLKNILLMIPALFILCVISFVTYCTLFLALPWRYSQELNNYNHTFLSIIFCIIFIIICLMTYSSFLKCVFTSSAVRDNPIIYSKHTELNSDNTLDIKKCVKCSQLKPERAHHCSICGTCILKMDHHCPWVSNCVGYYNYKYFCLFVWYGTIGCHMSTLMCLSDLYLNMFGHNISNNSNISRYNGKHTSWMMINSLITLAFGITLSCFSIFHLTLVLKGSTTIEFAGSKKYSRGWKLNFKDIFGYKWYLWFLPIFTAIGDGYEFNNSNDNERLLSMNDYSSSDDYSSD